jgi:ribosomal protein S18 acetylase RimI-like enzyme
VIIAERQGVVLRHAQKDDFPKIDEITIICYTNIQASYVSMLGEDCYQAVRHNPELTWQERKTGQVHRLFSEHPEQVWVLEKQNEVFGFVTFYLFPEQQYGHIDNNGVHPGYAGKAGESLCIRTCSSTSVSRDYALPTWIRDLTLLTMQRGELMKRLALTARFLLWSIGKT